MILEQNDLTPKWRTAIYRLNILATTSFVRMLWGTLMLIVAAALEPDYPTWSLVFFLPNVSSHSFPDMNGLEIFSTAFGGARFA
jgi:hypothetical protein